MYLVVYDMINSKRLKKVSKKLENYGLRVQNSTFEIDTTINNLNISQLFSDLQELCEDGDKIFIYKTKNKIDIQQDTDNWNMVF